MHPLEEATIIAEQKRLVAQFPGNADDIYEQDLEHERAFRQAVLDNLPIATPRMRYVIETRQQRLNRIRDYEQSEVAAGAAAVGDELVDDDPPEHNLDQPPDLAAVGAAVVAQLEPDEHDTAAVIADNTAVLHGTWRCESVAEADIEAETIHVRAVEGKPGFLSVVYDEDEEGFAIHVTAESVRVIPQTGRRKRKRLGFELDGAEAGQGKRILNEDSLVWLQPSSGTKAVWNRVSRVPQDRPTRGAMKKRKRIVETLTVKRDQKKRVFENQHRYKCCCLHHADGQCSLPASRRLLTMSKVPKATPVSKKIRKSRRATAELARKRVIWFRKHFNVFKEKKCSYYGQHHWPRAFWEKYGEGWLPKYLDVEEALELGVYIRNHPAFKGLRTKRPKNGKNEDGTAAQVIITVPWLSAAAGVAQYETEGSAQHEAGAVVPNDNSNDDHQSSAATPARNILPIRSSEATQQINKYLTPEWCDKRGNC